MSIKISEFKPRTLQLADDEREELKGVWVRVAPPTWNANVERQELLTSLYSGGPFFNDTRIIELEIYLCFAGTNLEVEVPKRTEDGGYVWDGDEPVMEVVKFSEDGSMTREDFIANLRKLPSYVVSLWHDRTLEVAEQWSPSFRREKLQ